MPCIVRIYGSGLNCNNGNPIGNYSTIDYPENTILVSMQTCGYPSLRLQINGVLRPIVDTYHPANLTITRIGCDDINPNSKCDCLNGGCVSQSTYNTPGKYANLAACLAGCAKDSTCTGECVSASEIADLQQAADNLRARVCG